MPSSFLRPRRLLTRACVLLILVAVGVASCDGGSQFPTLPGGPGGTTEPPPGSGSSDTTRPTAEIESPTAGFTVAVGDSVFVQVRIQDNQALASLELSGFSVRGNPALGTDQYIERFSSKNVAFDPQTREVRDTVITRYLLATADTLPETPVFLVATVRDAAGNVGADTVHVTIGGPRVQISAPEGGTEFRAGTPLQVRISAADRVDRVRALRLLASGALTLDTTLVLSALAEEADTVVTLEIPAGAAGELRLEAGATNARNVEAVSRPVVVRVVAPGEDRVPPQVSFTMQVRPRAEANDTLSVTLLATDDTQVATVGVSILALRRLAGRTDTLQVLTRRAARNGTVEAFALREFNLPAVLTDTLTVSFEVTAFALDAAGNCGAATVGGTPLAEPCREGPGGSILSDRPGARTDVLVVRGQTVALGHRLDRFVDLVSDGRSVYLSNYSQNRVEAVDVRSLALFRSVRVGSQPWGLAISPDSNTLIVANSGGTNLSRIRIRNGVPDAVEDSTQRIYTPNVRLFDVAFDPLTDEPSAVVVHSYSDRPQFVGQTAGGDILYSTKPTRTAAPGTIRRYVPGDNEVEFFIDYARVGNLPNKVIILNAEDAAVVLSEPRTLRVCPRRPSQQNTNPPCFVGSVHEVEAAILAAGYTDTRFKYNHDIELVGLSDTTYVAVSGDHRQVLFGEGIRDPGRVIWVRHDANRNPPVVQSGRIRDLLNNAAERVTGLSVDWNGSLAVARGREHAYFFTDQLRLQGVSPVGSGVGGLAMHPDHRGWPSVNEAGGMSFVAGVEANGLPFVDVIDTFHFDQRTSTFNGGSCRALRLYVRSEITGPLRVVRLGGEQGAAVLRVFAITADGMLALDIQEFDLQQC